MASMNMQALLELVQGKKAEIKARSGGFTNLVKPPAGKSRWRILPGWKKPEMFFHDFGQHYVKDTEGNVKAVFVCERATFGKDCPICDTLGEAIRASKDDKIVKALGQMKSRAVFLANALRMDGESADPTKPVLFQFTSKVMNDYINLMAERAGDDINILDVEHGRDVIILREGVGLNTTYSLNDAPKNTAVRAEALANLIDIDQFIEDERSKGLARGTQVVADMTRQIMALPAAHAPGASPALVAAGRAMSASLVPASRVIDVDEDPPAEIAVKSREKAAEAAPASDAVLGDKELEELLAALD